MHQAAAPTGAYRHVHLPRPVTDDDRRRPLLRVPQRRVGLAGKREEGREREERGADGGLEPQFPSSLLSPLSSSRPDNLSLRPLYLTGVFRYTNGHDRTLSRRTAETPRNDSRTSMPIGRTGLRRRRPDRIARIWLAAVARAPKGRYLAGAGAAEELAPARTDAIVAGRWDRKGVVVAGCGRPARDCHRRRGR